MNADDPDGRRAVEARLRAAKARKPPEPAPKMIPSSASWTHGADTYAEAWQKSASEFWSRSGRAAWRPDLAQSVFLGRAVLRLGRALYPDEWNDDDLYGKWLAPPVIADPGAHSPTQAAWLRIHEVLGRLTSSGQARSLEWRIDIGVKHPLRVHGLAKTTRDDLVRLPIRVLASCTQENIFYDCQIDTIEPGSEFVRRPGIGSDLFVDREELEVMERNEFWAPGRRPNWPKGNSGKVFLAEAILRVGKAKFGADWRDDGPLHTIRPETPTWNPADGEIPAIFAEREQEREKRRIASASNARVAFDLLISAAADGSLRLFTSPYDRREYAPCHSSWWVPGDWEHLLATCSLDPERPQRRPNPRNAQWVFVEQADLEAIEAVIAGSVGGQYGPPRSASEDATDPIPKPLQEPAISPRAVATTADLEAIILPFVQKRKGAGHAFAAACAAGSRANRERVRGLYADLFLRTWGEQPSRGANSRKEEPGQDAS